VGARYTADADRISSVLTNARANEVSAVVQVFGRRQERGARHAQLTGVQKAPRQEVAGSWAPAGQRRYGDLLSATTLMVGATLPGSDRDVWTREVGGCNGHLGKRSEGISGRSAH
jgi:hypothetical protein